MTFTIIPSREDLIYAALGADEISCFPDFVEAVRSLIEECEGLRADVARFKSERSYVIGFNEGWESALEQQEGDGK